MAVNETTIGEETKHPHYILSWKNNGKVVTLLRRKSGNLYVSVPETKNGTEKEELFKAVPEIYRRTSRAIAFDEHENPIAFVPATGPMQVFMDGLFYDTSFNIFAEVRGLEEMFFRFFPIAVHPDDEIVEVFVPYGSFLEGTSTDEDYVKMLLSKTTAGKYGLNAQGIDFNKDNLDIIELHPSPPLNERSVADYDSWRLLTVNLVFFNLLKDYGRDVAEMWKMFHEEKIKFLALEDFLDFNVKVRKNALQRIPSSFFLRKYVFALSQQFAYRADGIFVNRKSEVLPYATKLLEDEKKARAVLFEYPLDSEIHLELMEKLSIPLRKGDTYVYRIYRPRTEDVERLKGIVIALRDEENNFLKVSEKLQVLDNYMRDATLHPSSKLIVGPEHAVILRYTTCESCSRGFYVILDRRQIEPTFDGLVVKGKLIPLILEESLNMGSWPLLFHEELERVFPEDELIKAFEADFDLSPAGSP